MIIAIASGKGGTGKTTIATNLAKCLQKPIRLLDCDVEEPNCHIFLKPDLDRGERATLPVPVIDEELCNNCGECGRMCQFNAIVSLKTKPLVFPALCHGCGGCMKVCPTGAITEGEREIGTVETGTSGHVEFVQGRLDVGQAQSPPLIRAVKRHIAKEGVTIIDCPPGTSCPVIAAVKGCDYAVLVTESTPFGLHDLKLAVDTVRLLHLDFGVVINRTTSHDVMVREFCKKERIPVLLEIPDDRRVAEAYSRGRLIVEAVPELRDSFERLCCAVIARIQHRDAANSPCGEAASGVS